MSNNLIFIPFDKKFIYDIQDILISKYQLKKYLNKVFPYNVLYYLGLYNNNLFLLFNNNEIVGSILLRKRISHKSFKKFWWIYGVYIDKKYRKKGYGKIIMNEAVNWLHRKSVNKVYLYVDSNNIKAISLYKKIEFKIIEKSKFHKIDSSQLLMRKCIK